MQTEQKVDLILALLSGELANIQGKADFSKTFLSLKGHSPLFQNKKGILLDDVLPTLSSEELEELDDNKLKLVCVAWEFVWGKQPPEIITELKQSIRTKAECGLRMDELEILCYQLSAMDTDSF